MLDALQHSFFQHALVAGTLVAIMCSFLGVYVVLKRIVFLSIALAQIASAGLALGLLLHLHPLLTALAGSLAGAACLAQAGQRRLVPVEAVLGISYVLAAALAVIFIAKNPVGEARALNMFFGNILSVPTAELVALATVVPLIGLIHFLFAKEFLFVAFDFETARAQGVNARLWDLLLYLTLALAVGLAIKTTGVLVTFALLVVPATTARLLVNRIAPMFALAIAFGIVAVPLGLFLALSFNLPTGSTIAATSTGLLILVALGRQVASALRPRPALALVLAAALLLALGAPAKAEGQGAQTLERDLEQLKQAVRELAETVRAQQELILKQQRQIEMLTGGRQGAPQAPSRQAEAPPAAPASPPQALPPSQKEITPASAEPPRLPPWVTLLPELRVEGNFIYNQTFRNRRQLEAALGEEQSGEEFFVRRNRFNFREIELGLRSAVDPFATFEGIISGQETFGGDVEIELEEGFLTFARLPFRLGAKIGRLRTTFGEFNDSDPEEFPEVDPPNVIRNLFGKEGDGWIDTGIRVELPFALGDVPFLLSGGIFNGDNDEAFHGGRAGVARKPAYFGRLEAFFELEPAAALEIGAGYAYGHTLDEAGQATLRSRIFNAHLEFDYRHPLLGLYRGFNFLTELYYSWRDRLIEAEVDGEQVIIGREVLDRYGLYALGELQLTRSWFVSGRFDYSELPEREETGPPRRIETAGSAILSYKPSRFLTLRAQYKHTERNFAPDSDELFLQALFIIGFERPGPF